MLILHSYILTFLHFILIPHRLHAEYFFANLKINNTDAQNLEVAWIYYSKHGNQDIQCNPIAINGIVYTPVSGGHITAINGETGKEIWQSKKFGLLL